MKIGVVIATYNGEKFIREQLESVIRQTVVPDEIIISDANSNDNTLFVCNKIFAENNYVNYKIIQNKKRLSSQENFEVALANCSAEYVFFSDQDDVWLKNKIELSLNEMLKKNADVIFTNAEIVDENLIKLNCALWQRIGFSVEKKITEFNSKKADFFKIIIKNNVITGMTICAKMEFIKSIMPFEKDVLHDYWIALMVSINGKAVAFDEKLVLYRQHRNNVVGTRKDIRKTYRKRYEYLDKIKARIKAIERVLLCVDGQVDCCVQEAVNFFKWRVAFIEKKVGFFEIFKQNSKYKKYSESSFVICLKDIFVRLCVDSKK